MGGYQRFVTVEPEPRVVWAISSDEAKLHSGKEVVPAPLGMSAPNANTPSAWDIYLVGHGYSLSQYMPDEYAPRLQSRTLRVPEGVTVLFYVDDGDMFDSRWEEPTRQAIESPDQPANGARAVSETVPSGNPEGIAEHILVWPSLETSFEQAEMIRMVKVGTLPLEQPVPMALENAQLQLDGVALTDRCCLYIGSRKPMRIQSEVRKNVLKNLFRGNWVFLSTVLDLVAQCHVPTRVHWFACRSSYPETSRKFYAQCISPFRQPSASFDMEEGLIEEVFAP